MLRVMLCGASDTADVRDQFAEVISGFGGEPLHYLAGGVQYLNSADSNWSRNSQITVRAADMCVFVIIEKYGEITWSTELREARSAGKPFLVLCLDRTYTKYEVLRNNLTDTTGLRAEDDRLLLETIREMEFGWQLTLVPFSFGTFPQILRRQMATLFHLTLHAQQERNRRAAIARLAAEGERLTAEEQAIAVKIATDNLEEKNIRKRAVVALARSGVDPEVALELLSSDEQGVQRLAVEHLADLYRDRPVEPEFLAQCVQIANAADDVGITRRLIPTLLDLDVVAGISALNLLSVAEVGTRRRIAESLERYEEAIVAEGVRAEALALLARCLEDSSETGWKARCRQLHARLSTE
ncbi:hypothetical protein [Actinokineospora sp. UTMC 2448]|uniref:hypothetical protein n=1 Tax=Actinokineospora sp. UTMC 2448 TaxID=2268449 RepID=UPI0021641BC9|nr:hypothetical protein [Actinokineospora sp. UTMC 2448]UVS80563.1 hypothetical protein Actkin_04314 [Actinokineospora sp. UTMC 2448]